MSEIADKLRQQFQDSLNGEMQSCTIAALDDLKIYWKPLTGKQTKQIQLFAEKSTAEGMCMHVKTRAMTEEGEAIFKDIGVPGLMNDFDFETISKIFFAMTGMELTAKEIEGN